MLSLVVGSCLGNAEYAIDGLSKSTNRKAYAAFVQESSAFVVSHYWSLPSSSKAATDFANFQENRP